MATLPLSVESRLKLFDIDNLLPVCSSGRMVRTTYQKVSATVAHNGSDPRPLLPNHILAESDLSHGPTSFGPSPHLPPRIVPFLFIRSIPYRPLCRSILKSTLSLEIKSQHHRLANLTPITTKAALSNDTFRDESTVSARKAPSHPDSIDRASKPCKYTVPCETGLRRHTQSSLQLIG
jgi:hypothetical protein